MRILLCDDDRPLLRVIEVTLTSRGHHVNIASDSAEAADLFDMAGPDGFDLIVTDQEMPGPSGFYLGSWVRSRGYQGRLAVMTGYEAEPANLASINAEYWKKPDAFSAPVLIGLVVGTPLVVEG